MPNETLVPVSTAKHRTRAGKRAATVLFWVTLAIVVCLVVYACCQFHDAWPELAPITWAAN